MMGDELEVVVVDDTTDARESIVEFLCASGLTASGYESAQAFLDSGRSRSAGCLVLDLKMPDMNGLELQQALAAAGTRVPIIFLSGEGAISDVSAAFRCGAVDFLQKPVDPSRLLGRVREALNSARDERVEDARRAPMLRRLQRLTTREREVMSYIVGGTPNKVIARHLGVSHRTVEAHRAHIMDKMEADSIVELVEAARLGGLEVRSIHA